MWKPTRSVWGGGIERLFIYFSRFPLLPQIFAPPPNHLPLILTTVSPFYATSRYRGQERLSAYSPESEPNFGRVGKSVRDRSLLPTRQKGWVRDGECRACLACRLLLSPVLCTSYSVICLLGRLLASFFSAFGGSRKRLSAYGTHLGGGSTAWQCRQFVAAPDLVCRYG